MKSFALIATKSFFKMKITQYLRSIGNLFGKGTVLEDLRLTRTIFNDMKPHLQGAEKAMARFKTKEMNAINAAYGTAVRGASGKSIFGHIAANMNNITATIDTLEAIVAGEFDERIAAQGLDYRRANVLQLTDALVFCSRFTFKLLSHALKLECAAARADKKMVEVETNEVMAFEESFIKEGLNPFCRAMAVFTMDAKQNADRLSEIPEILATDANYNQLRGTIGEIKLDPFGMGATNFRYNPFRAIGMARVEIKAARAREAEVELQMAQLRLMQLERTRQGKEDPALEREIRYMQSLIDDLTQELDKYNNN